MAVLALMVSLLVVRNYCLREVECFEILVACTLPSVNQVGNFVFLLVLPTAVQLNKVVNREIASSYSNHDSFPFNLHKYSFSVVSVDALGLTLEIHFASHSQRFCVDVVS